MLDATRPESIPLARRVRLLVVVAALGYFVDIYDLILVNIVRRPSLTALGVPADRIEDMFRPFVRLEDSRSRETGGAGLGLAVVRDIARAHGGDAILRNRRGRGLEAVLTLPRIA